MKTLRCNQSRREFLRVVLGAGGSLLFRPPRLNATSESLDPRVTKVMARVIGIDMHNHVYPEGTQPHPQSDPPHGSQGGPPKVDSVQGRDEQHGSAPSLAGELGRSGLAAVCASFVLDFATYNKPGDARDNYLRWLSAIDAQLEIGHIRRALNMKDLQSAHDQGKPTIVQTVEGAMFIEGHLDRVEEVYRRGLRHLQLLHERDDMVTPLGDVNTAPAHLGGLTRFGAEVVKECNRLGVVVDLAHASQDTVIDTLKIAKQPVVISHTNLDAWTGKNPKMAEIMKPRLISREQAKIVADAGGVVGVWTHLTDSLHEFVESIKAMVDAIGIDHVGIGTDTDLLSSRAGQGTNVAYPNVGGSFFPAVVGEMLYQGFTPDEIGKIGGGNYCRIFGLVTAGQA